MPLGVVGVIYATAITKGAAFRRPYQSRDVASQRVLAVYGPVRGTTAVPVTSIVARGRSRVVAVLVGSRLRGIPSRVPPAGGARDETYFRGIGTGDGVVPRTERRGDDDDARGDALSVGTATVGISRMSGREHETAGMFE